MRRLAITLCVPLFSLSPALAQKVTLRVADTFPTGHYIEKNLTSVW